MTLTTLVVGLVVMPPFVPPLLRGALYDAFAVVCHQLPDRTYHANGHPLAVCHRCLGIYATLPLGGLLLLRLRHMPAALTRHAPWLLLLAVAIPGADWLLGALGIWENTPVSRLVTGGAFGLVAGLYLARAVAMGGPAERGAVQSVTKG